MRAHIRRYALEFEEAVLNHDQTRTQSVILLNVTTETPAPKPLEFRLAIPAALNLPAGFIQVPFVLASGDNTEWAPHDMSLGEWRALTWPFVGIAFWWIAGRGLEAFFAAARTRRFAIIRPRLGRGEVTVGIVLFVVGMGASFLFALGHNPLGLMTHWIFAAASALWGVLGAFMVAGRLLQARIRREARRDAIAYVL